MGDLKDGQTYGIGENANFRMIFVKKKKSVLQKFLRIKNFFLQFLELILCLRLVKIVRLGKLAQAEHVFTLQIEKYFAAKSSISLKNNIS